MKIHEIKYNDQVVGSAEITVEGLFYKISCRCKLPKDTIYRIYAATETAETDLGICIPKGDFYVLVKRIPIKQIGRGEIIFRVHEKSSIKNADAILVDPEKPFAYIDKLENARLEFRDGQPYIKVSSTLTDPA